VQNQKEMGIGGVGRRVSRAPVWCRASWRADRMGGDALWLAVEGADLPERMRCGPPDPLRGLSLPSQRLGLDRLAREMVLSEGSFFPTDNIIILIFNIC
jgi:hypothetical protein